MRHITFYSHFSKTLVVPFSQWSVSVFRSSEREKNVHMDIIDRDVSFDLQKNRLVFHQIVCVQFLTVT